MAGGSDWRLTALCVSLCAALASAETAVIEGFENPNAIVVTTGQLTLVSKGAAVTEGGGACRLAGRTEIRMSFPVKQLEPFIGGWLRLDTHHAEPVAQPIRVTMSAGGASGKMTGYVTKGADTLAIPLTTFIAGADLETGQVNLSIENLSRADVVLDNLRLQTPTTPPAGAVLLDLGAGEVWPGFTPVDRKGSKSLRWDTESPHSGRVDWPDPLRGDYVGATVWGSGECDVSLSNGYPDGAMVWIWLTHFGGGYHQPATASFAVGRQPVLVRQSTVQQLLSPAAAFEGFNQNWTPQWALEELIPRRFEKLSFRLPKGFARCQLMHAQIAAVVMVPYHSRKEGADFVGRVEADLAKYLRQFLLPDADRAAIPPSLDERQVRSGLVVYLPGDLAHSAPLDLSDQPALEKLSVTVAPGMRYTAPLVVWPVADRIPPTVRPGPFVQEKVAMLPRTTVNVDWLSEIVGRADGRPVGRPWYRAVVTPRAVGGKPLVAMLNVEVPKLARPGSYSGPVTFSCREAEWIVQLTIKVVPLPATREKATFGVLQVSPLSNAYGPARDLLSAPQRMAMVKKLWGACTHYGLNALTVRGPTYNWDGKRLLDAVTIESVKTVPPRRLTGLNLLDLSDVSRWTGRNSARPGSARFSQYFGAALARALTLAKGARIGKPLIYLGNVSNEDDMKRALGAARVLRGKDFAPAMSMSLPRWEKLPEKTRAACIETFDGLILSPDGTGATDMVAAIAAKAPGRVMLQLFRPDRFTVGFYAWALRTRGVYLPYPLSPRPAYNPFYFTGYGLFMPTPKGDFLPTVNMYGVRQGIDDRDLLQRCEALVDLAKTRKAPDRGLAAELEGIRQAVLGAGEPTYSEAVLRSDVVPPSQMDQWRGKLLDLAGGLAVDLKVR